MSDVHLEINLALFGDILEAELFQDNFCASDEAATYVVNKIIYPRKGNMRHSLQVLQLASETKEHKKFSHIALERALRNNNFKMEPVTNLREIEERVPSVFIVYCKLNSSFTSLKYTNTNENDNHVVLIRNGMILCPFLRDKGRPVKLSVRKHLFFSSDTAGLNNTRNSYIKDVVAAFKIFSHIETA